MSYDGAARRLRETILSRSERATAHDEEPPRHFERFERGRISERKEGDAEREPLIRFVRSGKGWECSELTWVVAFFMSEGSISLRCLLRCLRGCSAGFFFRAGHLGERDAAPTGLEHVKRRPCSTRRRA